MVPVPWTDTEDELEAIVESRMAANKNNGQPIQDSSVMEGDSDEEEALSKMVTTLANQLTIKE